MSTVDVPGRPTVDEVAEILRARTKDSMDREVGTFDEDTRPTADEVEKHIDAAYAVLSVRIPPPATLSAPLQSAMAVLVAYRAAMRIEKSYFPEQVRTDRSPYEQLRQEYLDDLEPWVEAANEEGGEMVGDRGFGMIVVGSWTSIGYLGCCDDLDMEIDGIDPELPARGPRQIPAGR
jgi:hypothetical protein